MLSYLKGSILYSIFKTFIDSYNKSTLKRFNDTFVKYAKESAINKWLDRYTKKESTAKYTLTYKLLSKMCSLLDVPVSKIHNIFVPYIKESKCYLLYNTFVIESKNRMDLLLSVPILGFVGGYSILTTINANWTTRSAYLMLILVLISLIMISTKGKFTTWIKNSNVYKFCHYIID